MNQLVRLQRFNEIRKFNPKLLLTDIDFKFKKDPIEKQNKIRHK